MSYKDQIKNKKNWLVNLSFLSFAGKKKKMSYYKC
jgi:hypothetical protein